MSRVIPYELAALRGNPGKRRLRPGPQPTRTEAAPEPFPFLSEAAKAEWRRLAPELHRLRLLTPIDHAVFGAYCASFGRWVEAEHLLETKGLLAKGSTQHRGASSDKDRNPKRVRSVPLRFGIWPDVLRAGRDASRI